jgi:hypothetical protein
MTTSAGVMKLGHYILDDHNVAVPVDFMTWARWYEANSHRRVVAKATLAGGVVVSTVFLGLDHSWGPGPRHIFETMVFGGEHDGDTERYATWAQAEAGHAVMVRRIREPATPEPKPRRPPSAFA